MKEEIESKYVKRTQKDYPHAFKLQVVDEIESGSITAGDSRRKLWYSKPRNRFRVVTKIW